MTNQQLFLAVAPIVLSQITLIIVLIFGFLNQNHRIDDLAKGFQDRFNDIARRLDRIEGRLDHIEDRLTSLEKKVEALEIKAWR